MRAVILITDTIRGGAQHRCASIARGMAERGWQILFVSLAPGGPVLEDLSEAGVATASLEATSWRQFPRVTWSFRRLTERWKPHVVQTALWHANILGRLALVGTGVPLIDSYESVDVGKPPHRVLLDRLTRGLADAHVAVADAVAEVAYRRERIPPNKAEVIPLGVDVDLESSPSKRAAARSRFSRSWGIPEDVPLVAWAGRLHPDKDPATLLRALARLQDWWLVMAGDGPLFDRIGSWAAELGVADRVVATGELEDVFDLLASADVFCLSSRWEGMPLALLEAMAAGLPVVATDVGGVSEVVTPDSGGLLVPPGDPSALAAAIESAATRPELGGRSRETARRFSREAMVAAYDILWRQVSDNRSDEAASR